MQKHWYILYTKAKCEKKVTGLLTKKKIKNFCPVHCRRINEFRRMKLVYEPLFPSYVFVYIHESAISQVKQLNHVLNVVYWKSEPAIIQDEEIEEIKEFVTHHQNIKLERSRVIVKPMTSVTYRPSYSVDGNVVMIKNKFIKVNLQSLGYIMVAQMEDSGVMGRDIGVREKEEIL
jgi:transcription antitermination factor NusG